MLLLSRYFDLSVIDQRRGNSALTSAAHRNFHRVAILLRYSQQGKTKSTVGAERAKSKMSDITSAEIRNTTRSKPAGFCIYCGRTDSLTEEHVIPFALSGNLIIPDASCPSCCNMTSAFEPKVLRGFMHDARIAGNFPTRRRKKRPAAIPIKIKQNKSFESIELSSNDAIGVLQLPMIEKAAFLAGKPPTRGARIYGTQTIVFGRSLEDVAKNLGVEALEFTANIDAYAFVRMLAKIGYCFAVATMGSYSLAEVPVLPLICGKADDGST